MCDIKNITRARLAAGVFVFALLTAILHPMQPVQAAASDTISMMRLYNPATHEHLHTSDAYEKYVLTNNGWEDEGYSWEAPATSSTPVYRLFNQWSGEHFYTVDAYERSVLIGDGWNDEGIGWYSDDLLGVPVYRVFNAAAGIGAHHYTTDENEYWTLVSEQGWTDEGIAWYGVGAGAQIIGRYQVFTTDGNMPQSVEVTQNGQLIIDNTIAQLTNAYYTENWINYTFSVSGDSAQDIYASYYGNTGTLEIVRSIGDDYCYGGYANTEKYDIIALTPENFFTYFELKDDPNTFEPYINEFGKVEYLFLPCDRLAVKNGYAYQYAIEYTLAGQKQLTITYDQSKEKMQRTASNGDATVISKENVLRDSDYMGMSEGVYVPVMRNKQMEEYENDGNVIYLAGNKATKTGGVYVWNDLYQMDFQIDNVIGNVIVRK